MAILIDALLITVAIFMVARGARRGLVLSLLGLIAFIAALFGAKLAAQYFAPELASKLTASIEQTVTERLQTVDFTEENSQELLQQAVPDIIKSYGFYDTTASQISELVKDGVDEVSGELIPAIAAATAGLVAETAAEVIIFTAAFLIISLLIWGLGKLLNLVFQLPVLRECNALGGAIFGAAKAVLVLLVVAWLVRYAGLLVPEETVQKTYVLRFLTKLIH